MTLQIRVYIVFLFLLAPACVSFAGNCDYTAATASFSDPVRGIGNDILSCPESLAQTASAPLTPALPAAILLTIAGFACVSFVRDRATWLSILICFAAVALPHQLAGKIAQPLTAATRKTCEPFAGSILPDSIAPASPQISLDYAGLLYRLTAGDAVAGILSQSKCFYLQIESSFTFCITYFTLSIQRSFVLRQLPRGPPNFHLRL